MADAVATPTAPEKPNPSEQIDKLEKSLGEMSGLLEKLSSQPVYPNGVNPGALLGGQPPNYSRQVGEKPYSFGKAVSFATNGCDAESAVEEIQIHRKLRKMYAAYDESGGFHSKSIIIPFSTAHFPQGNQEAEKLAVEIRQKSAAAVAGYDYDEALAIAAKYPHLKKALGTVSDTAGGSLVGFPQLMEMIELQRNLEVFANAGASEIALPSNGRMSFPKQTGASTFYWVPEGIAITESQPTTGSLLLEAKKAAVLVKVNNELFRFANPSAEAMLRMDMARVLALGIDLAMLQGTGGTQIKGLITYSDITTLVASTVTANGNTFEPQDVGRMEGVLPDAVPDPTAYVMRRDMAQAIANRKADAVAAGDQKGPFMFSITRDQNMGAPKTLGGTKLVRSGQVSNTRSKGSATNLTYIICGAFYDWITARLGVMEVLASSTGDTPLVNDQTWVRAIQHIDAGPRHAASFVFTDTLVVA